MYLLGFQPIPALANLEGLLNILAPASSVADDENVLPSSQSKAKEQDLVQHKGCLGFLQGFLKLQQAMEEVKLAQDQSQVYSICFTGQRIIQAVVKYGKSLVVAHRLVCLAKHQMGDTALSWQA